MQHKKVGIKDKWPLTRSGSSVRFDFTRIYDSVLSLELLTNIAVIESEGVTIDGNSVWVKSFAVSTSNDSTLPTSWKTHPEGNPREVIAKPVPLR